MSEFDMVVDLAEWFIEKGYDPERAWILAEQELVNPVSNESPDEGGINWDGLGEAISECIAEAIDNGINYDD